MVYKLYVLTNLANVPFYATVYCSRTFYHSSNVVVDTKKVIIRSVSTSLAGHHGCKAAWAYMKANFGSLNMVYSIYVRCSKNCITFGLQPLRQYENLQPFSKLFHKALYFVDWARWWKSSTERMMWLEPCMCN